MTSQNIYFESGLSVDEATRRALRSDFAALIRDVISDKYGTQKNAELALGIPQSTISNIMCGNTRRLSLDYLVGLAAKMGIPWSARCLTPPHDAQAILASVLPNVTRQSDFQYETTFSSDKPIEVGIRATSSDVGRS